LALKVYIYTKIYLDIQTHFAYNLDVLFVYIMASFAICRNLTSACSGWKEHKTYMPRQEPKNPKLPRIKAKRADTLPNQPNGLRQIADQLRALYQKNAHRGTNVDVIYATLRDAIRSQLIRPGIHLTELDLSTALGISRTPVREALQRLENEYLLEKSPRRGFVIPTLHLNDIVEIFEIREVLLGLAARCAAQRANPAEITMMAETITRMEQAKDAEDSGGLSQASAQFHRAIEQAAKNRRLQKLIRLNSSALPLYEFADPARFAPSVAEHRAIFDAIAAHDSSLAERLAHEHSRNALQAQSRMTQLTIDGLLDGD
jgi:DNA-binding GntR family transcriptional regulator